MSLIHICISKERQRTWLNSWRGVGKGRKERFATTSLVPSLKSPLIWLAVLRVVINVNDVRTLDTQHSVITFLTSFDWETVGVIPNSRWQAKRTTLDEWGGSSGFKDLLKVNRISDAVQWSTCLPFKISGVVYKPSSLFELQGRFNSQCRCKYWMPMLQA